jgi:hypothetical protein
MKNFLLLVILIVMIALLGSLPLYLCVNFVCWAFHLSFHITLIQSLALSLLASVVHSLLFKNSKEGK